MFASTQEITPRTQKVTLAGCGAVGPARSRRGAIRRGATCRGRRGNRNAVSDDDVVIAYQNLLDNQTHDPLALHYVKRIGAAAQSGQERGEGLCQAQERGALIGLVSDRLQFGA